MKTTKLMMVSASALLALVVAAPAALADKAPSKPVAAAEPKKDAGKKDGGKKDPAKDEGKKDATKKDPPPPAGW